MIAYSSTSARQLAVAGLFAIIGLAGAAPAQGTDPAPVLPEQLRWFSPPGNPAVQGAWVLGEEQKPGPYLFRVKLAPGAKIPPHTHPDERTTTVLSGTILIGFGTTFDEAKMVAVPTGGVYVAPSGVPHYVAAKDGAAVYQEAGTGPTKTTPVAR